MTLAQLGHLMDEHLIAIGARQPAAKPQIRMAEPSRLDQIISMAAARTAEIQAGF